MIEKPRRLTAQVAPYLEAITQARNDGYTWQEIHAALLPSLPALEGGGWRRLWEATKRARRALEDGRLSPKQLPLPGSGAPSSRAEQRPAPAVEGASRPLPGDPSRRRMPTDGDEARAELERKGIVFR